MELPITPQMTANVDDHSAVDESTNQHGDVHIHASGNATINSNSGNGKTNRWGVSALFQFFAWSMLCDILVCGFLWMHGTMNQAEMNSRLEKGNQDVNAKIEKVEQQISKVATSTEKVAVESKEGTIWILRRDILNSIDFHEQTKMVTAKQYKRIKDQFDYYTSIGGNHDVKSRFDDFTTKVMGTGEIKMEK